MIWEDCTSYSQNKPRIPRWWRLKIANLHLAVGNEHRYYPDGTWVFNCSPWFDARQLKATNEQDAKAEAVKVVREVLEKIVADLR